MTNAPPAPLAARDPEATLMFSEAAESGAAVARLLAANADAFATLGAKLRAAPPAVVVTCARGSSDHAAVYGKYLIWTKTGIPVAAAAQQALQEAGGCVRGGGWHGRVLGGFQEKTPERARKLAAWPPRHSRAGNAGVAGWCRNPGARGRVLVRSITRLARDSAMPCPPPPARRRRPGP